MRACVYGGLTTWALLLLCTGCATLPRRAQIPLGQWQGQGRFVISKWASTSRPSSAPWGDDHKAAASSELQTEHGRYPTSLKIEPAEGNDHDQGSVRIEIVSQRGRTKLLEGDRTHLVAILSPARSLAHDKIVLYRLAELGVSTSQEPPRLDKQPEGRTYAACIYTNGEVVLELHYMDEFVDTLRFRGDTVLKSGTYFESESGLILWSERLRRRR